MRSSGQLSTATTTPSRRGHFCLAFNVPNHQCSVPCSCPSHCDIRQEGLSSKSNTCHGEKEGPPDGLRVSEYNSALAWKLCHSLAQCRSKFPTLWAHEQESYKMAFPAESCAYICIRSFSILSSSAKSSVKRAEARISMCSRSHIAIIASITGHRHFYSAVNSGPQSQKYLNNVLVSKPGSHGSR